MMIVYGHSHLQYTTRDFNRPNTIPSPPSTSTQGQETFAPNFRGASGKDNPCGPSPSHALSTDSRLSESTDRATSPSLNRNATLWGTCSEHSKIITRHPEEWNGNRTSQGGTTTTVVLRRKPQTSLGIAVYFRKKTESYFYGEPTSSVGRQPECHDTQRAPMVRRNRSTRGSGPSRRLESGRVEEESTSG